MKGKFWVLAVFISAVAAGSVGYFAGRSELPAAPPEGWDNYKPANIGKEIRLHGAILHVYMVYGSPPYGEHEVSKFEHVLGEE